jgi:hypothetical protein
MKEAIMLTPTIHMNGTAGQDLLLDACTCGDVLRNAIDDIAKRGPNARDYYPQGDAAFSQARDEHRSRMDRLRAILKEYEAMAEAISDEMDEQAARKRRA